MKKEIAFIEDLAISFTHQNFICFNKSRGVALGEGQSFLQIIKDLSVKNLNSIKFTCEESTPHLFNLNPRQVIDYLKDARRLKSVTLEGPHEGGVLSEDAEEIFTEILTNLCHYSHLVIENNPFNLRHDFLSRLHPIQELTLNSPMIDLSLELVDSFPKKIQNLTLCRPGFSMIRLLEKLPHQKVQQQQGHLVQQLSHMKCINIRNPDKEIPFEKVEVEALFKSLQQVELALSLIKELPRKGEYKCKVEKIVLHYDGVQQFDHSIFQRLPNIKPQNIALEFISGSMWEFGRLERELKAVLEKRCIGES